MMPQEREGKVNLNASTRSVLSGDDLVELVQSEEPSTASTSKRGVSSLYNNTSFLFSYFA